MAKATLGAVKTYKKTKVSRPGIHAKTKKSVNKRGKHWKKEYRGQGR